MSKKVKIWLLIATGLVLIGLIVFGGVMASMKWDFTKLSTFRYETNTYEIDGDFEGIEILTNTADVIFEASQGEKTVVICHERTSFKHLVEVQNKTLAIEAFDNRKWYEYIGIDFDSPKITVQLPKSECGSFRLNGSTGDVEIASGLTFDEMEISMSTGDVRNYASACGNIVITTSTGDIWVENLSAANVKLSATTGDVIAKNLTCTEELAVNMSTGDTRITDTECLRLRVSGRTGDTSLENLLASELILVELSTGDIKLEQCDAAELFLKTSTGDVEGSLLSDKVFVYHTNTGDADLPKSTTGGLCEIVTSTGDIRIVYAGSEELYEKDDNNRKDKENIR